MNNQEQNWIQSARNGDQAAFGQLVIKYQKRVYALTVRMCPTPELAEEAAQETFLSAWQGLPFFRGDSAFSTWLYRLASNAGVDLLRKEGRHQGPSLDDEAVSAEVPDTRPTPEAAAEKFAKKLLYIPENVDLFAETPEERRARSDKWYAQEWEKIKQEIEEMKISEDTTRPGNQALG